MKFDHKVKYNGVWYEPGEEIEDGVGNTAPTNFSDFMTQPAKNFTKTEIKRMPVGNLRELASEYGIEDAEEKTGEELKDCLISVLKL